MGDHAHRTAKGPGEARARPLARYLLAGSAALWCGAILADPLRDLPGVHAFFSLICHQNPDRSWSIFGEPLAVCIRCTSIYAGFLVALVARVPADSRFLKAALAASVGEFLLARAGLDFEIPRALTGLALGLSAAGFVEQGVHELFRQRLRLPLAGASPGVNPGANR